MFIMTSFSRDVYVVLTALSAKYRSGKFILIFFLICYFYNLISYIAFEIHFGTESYLQSDFYFNKKARSFFTMKRSFLITNLQITRLPEKRCFINVKMESENSFQMFVQLHRCKRSRSELLRRSLELCDVTSIIW